MGRFIVFLAVLCTMVSIASATTDPEEDRLKEKLTDCVKEAKWSKENFQKWCTSKHGSLSDKSSSEDYLSDECEGAADDPGTSAFPDLDECDVIKKLNHCIWNSVGVVKYNGGVKFDANAVKKVVKDNADDISRDISCCDQSGKFQNDFNFAWGMYDCFKNFHPESFKSTCLSIRDNFIKWV